MSLENSSRLTSVIIPCFNGQAYLREALDSVQAQTRPVREIIVVDDGSTTPVSIPMPWDGPPIRLLRTPNRGLPAARNLGIHHATGTFLALLDADDAWAAGKIEAQEQALLSNADAVAVFTHTTVKEGWPDCGEIVYPSPNITHRDFVAHLWARNFIFPSSVMLRRSASIQAGGFSEDLRYCEDREFWFRLLSIGGFVQVTEPLCYRRMHAGQMTQNFTRMATFRRRALMKIVASSGNILESAGVSRGDQLRRVKEQYRYDILLAYFARDLAGVRGLLWRYVLRAPYDLEVLKYATLALAPRSWLVRFACDTDTTTRGPGSGNGLQGIGL